MKSKYTASPVADDVLPQTSSTSFESRTYAKVSRRLIPFLMLCYLGAYLDRVNVGFAKLQMLNDLRFSETVYGMGAGIFFLGYFLFEVPSNLVLHRVGARKWLARIMLTWAAISACFIFVKSPTAFYVLRFLLGRGWFRARRDPLFDLLVSGRTPGQGPIAVFHGDSPRRHDRWSAIGLDHALASGHPVSCWLEVAVSS
jgi:hypothetical protein